MGTPEVNLQAYNLYKPHLVHYLRPTDVALRLPDILTPEQKSEITRLENSGHGRQATEKLLEIVEKSDHTGRWQSFLKALEEYPRLIKILTSEPTREVEHQEYHVKWIHIFAPDLQKAVVPSHHLMLLLSEKVISEEDEQEIRRKEDGSGPQAAFPLLLDALPRRQEPRIWFPAFLRSLLKEGHQELVHEIDPDFCTAQKLGPIDMDEIQEPSGSGVSHDADHSGEIEMVVEDSGVPDDFIGDLAPPLPSSPQDDTEDNSGLIYERRKVESIESDGKPRMLVHPFTETESLLCNSDNWLTEVKATRSPEVKIKGDMVQNMNILDEKKESDQEKDMPGDQSGDHTLSFEPNVPIEADTMDSNQSESENELASDYESPDDVDEGPPNTKKMRMDTELKLRNYQLELAEVALQGENTIICAETGTGKTWVALYIAQKHLEAASPGKKRKVAFMAKTNPLIKQQHKRFCKYLPQYKPSIISGDSEEARYLDTFMAVSDIICCTPQILVNNLESKAVKSLSEFTLIILDECHHTKKEETYNKLMRKYLMAREKNNVKDLPQVVGLTASIGVGKSSAVDEAVNYILGIMANMDVCKLSTVQKYQKEQEKYVVVPKEEMVVMETAVNVKCEGKIEHTMITIEDVLRMQEPCLFEPALCELMSNKPSDYKVQNYMQWVRKLQKLTSTVVTETNQAKSINACARYFEILYAALEMNCLLTVQDVILFLSKQLKPISGNQEIHTEVEKKLFQSLKDLLLDLSKSHNDFEENPNLRKLSDILQKLILEEMKDKKSPRALVFVQTRATCRALVHFLKKEVTKKGIKVHYLTGTSAAGENDGMTEAEQTDALNKFEKGDYLVLVSTSVGSEGIDIPDCSIVLSYNYAGNEITKIQMRGRGRQKNSMKITIATDDVLKQERISTYRAHMMYKAIDKLKTMDELEILGRMRQIQRVELSKQEMQEQYAQEKESMKMEGNFMLKCKICSIDIVSSADIRCVKKSHHFVTNKKFLDLIVEKPDPKPKMIDGMNKTMYIHCKGCGENKLGVYFEYNKVRLPAIQICSFKVPSNDNEQRYTVYKKWKDVPFQVKNAELTDIFN